MPSSSSEPPLTKPDQQHGEQQSRRNRAYLSTLSQNLAAALRSYQSTFREGDVRRAANILQQIEREASAFPENKDQLEEARTMCELAGLDLAKLLEADAEDASRLEQQA